MRLLSYIVVALAADAAVASSWFSKAGELSFFLKKKMNYTVSVNNLSFFIF